MAKSKGLKSVIPLSLSNQVLEALGHSLLFEMKVGYSIAKCQTSVPLTFVYPGIDFLPLCNFFKNRCLVSVAKSQKSMNKTISTVKCIKLDAIM